MLQSNAALGFQVIGIAIDSPEKAQPMLDSMGITYPILYAEQTGMLLMEASGNPQGLLPYSLLLDSKGRVLEQRLGKIHEQDISIWIEQYLK
jgi:peroxiredoxin